MDLEKIDKSILKSVINAYVKASFGTSDRGK